MSDKKQAIHISPTGDELIIREGKAREIDELQSVMLSGNILTPAEFYNKNKDKLKDEMCILSCDTSNKALTLMINPQNTLNRIEVTGSLCINPVLTNVFKINQEHSGFDKNTFSKRVKLNRAHFKSQKESMDLVAKLESLEMQLDKHVKDADNKRGTYQREARQTAKTELPPIFTLQTPVFAGGDKQDIDVDIHFDVEGNELKFYFESAELAEYIEREGSKEMADQITLFNDEIVIIYQ